MPAIRCASKLLSTMKCHLHHPAHSPKSRSDARSSMCSDVHHLPNIEVRLSESRFDAHLARPCGF